MNREIKFKIILINQVNLRSIKFQTLIQKELFSDPLQTD